MRINTRPGIPPVLTHEGGRAHHLTPLQELRRSVMACLLWEDSFYEDGQSAAARIVALVPKVSASELAALAIEARTQMNLRHVPLLLCREAARNKMLRAETLAAVIQRADELAEFLAIYWKDGKRPLSAQVKKGLALAFRKFNEYSLAKYDRAGSVKLRDVLFLCHAKPLNDEQAALWKRLIAGSLAIPDTWEVALSAGANKQETWVRLIEEGKLGALALLRNLRNMERDAVPHEVITRALSLVDVSRVLPFRFIAAARFAPWAEPYLEAALFRNLEGVSTFNGTTNLLIDVSGSMDGALSAKSDMRRLDAACGLAMIAREVCANIRIYTFSEKLVEVPPRRGFALRDAIVASQAHSSTYLARAIAGLPPSDRLIVISDEQSHDDMEGVPAQRAYMLNVGAYQNGVGYGRKWTNISGFSEACVRYMSAIEEVGA